MHIVFDLMSVFFLSAAACEGARDQGGSYIQDFEG